MKVGDTVRVTCRGAFFDRIGKVVETGQGGWGNGRYDWQVRFPDAISNDDTYYFNTDELELPT